MVLFLSLSSGDVYSQNYTRQGTTFMQNSKAKKSSEAKRTKYTWKDSKGNEYPIYISASGSCFVYRTSSKTGNEYKQYLGKEISAEISKEMGIEYKPKK